MTITFNNSQLPEKQYVLPLLEKSIHVDNWKLAHHNSTDIFDLSISISEDVKVLKDKFPSLTVHKSKFSDAKELDTTTKFVKANENLWGLRSPKWSLKKQVCDYYLLTLSALVDPDKYQKHLDKRANVLSFQFARYTDMAVGGELRHTRRFIDDSKIDESQVPFRLREALRDSTLACTTSNVSRHSAWQGWYHFRRVWGKVAIKWAVDTYQLEGWNAGYGGHKWATIAETLYMYETGKITQNSFIDTCFGLQHNNGNYFNKWWSGIIQPVLDANQTGCYCFLYEHASHIVKKLVRQEIIREMCTCLENTDYCETYTIYGGIIGAKEVCH